MNSKFSISVKNVRAIEDAEIDLNGITVLAGENGCGKTTLSKLLYGFIKTSVNFDTAISNFYALKISFLSSLLEEMLLQKHENNFERTDEIDFFDSDGSTMRFLKDYNAEKFLSEQIIPRIGMVRKTYEENARTMEFADFKRLVQLYEKRCRKTEAKNITELLKDYESYANELLRDISVLKTTRNLKIFNAQISKCFTESTDKWNYSFKEYGADLINQKTFSVILQKSFSDVIYIDVPTVFDIDYNQARDWTSIAQDLRRKLYDSKQYELNEEISVIIEDVLNGKISKETDLFSRIFTYTAKNGKSIPLSQAASGLKCFAVLERLYANGCLGEDTLLIVDEPEVHLHPKWIVEYARVLVLIKKLLHTTILVASHNPDMISAIKYISEKEDVSDCLTFYIAEEVNSEGFGKYKFKNLGTDIEEIFASFNIALDRINQYGAFEDA